ncbi:MAG: ClpXP protease specificity-enhancing factor SspB [Kofleriaceae bacterium]
MATEPDPRVARLHDLLATLTEARFAASLTEVEQALAGWRAGDLETLVAHEAAVRHVERADAIMQEAMAAAAEPAALIALAAEAGLIDDDERAELSREPLPALAAASAPTVATAARPSKRAVADALLAKGPILVHLDARKPGVAVPSRFADEAKLVLRFGFGLSPPIADLVVDDVGIAGTLVFGGVPFGCVLPWTAIFALVLDGESRGMVWPEDAPGDLLEAAAEPSPDPEPDPEPPPRARRPSHLRLVD